MSDSESDLLPSNVFTFQNENTMISAKGPSVNSTNMTNISFRNNVMTSTMHLPRNFERQPYGEPSFDQRSMYYRRETSPASMYSGSDRRRNFHQSYYGGGMNSQRSMCYGRSGSPMSMRSMDSNASVSAADIALAFKNVNFNKHDLRMIKDAYNKFMKRRIRKKIEKRRNMRLFLKGYHRKSGYDSGEQGSDSSISSDDCKSTNSAIYKDNMSCRSTRTDLSDFRRSIQQSNMYKDCTNNFKHNAFRNMFSVAPVNDREKFHMNNTMQNPKLSQTEFAVPNPVQKPMFTQKDRFRSGYQLPSQRFNRSVASVPILERDPRLQSRQNILHSTKKSNIETGQLKHNELGNGETDSDQEEIFSEVTVREKSILHSRTQNDKITDQGKRSLEIEDSNRCSDRKRPKLSSPTKQKSTYDLINKNNIDSETKENKQVRNRRNNNDSVEKDQRDDTVTMNTKEFEFVKPQFPIRKSCPNKIKEKLISQSAPPLVDIIVPLNKPQLEKEAVLPKTTVTEDQPATTEDQTDITLNSNNDLSSRPSFIKRKLFTQKMDVTEKKNLNCDAINSPQTNVYSAIHKEKHKARKLVTNQSCLSRDIAQEGNNLLDLIHKIVPPDRINVTNANNKTSISTSVSSKNHMNDDDKWDVTSVISTCNNDDVSDTYTDEEIFRVDIDKTKMEKPNKSVKNINKSKENNKKIDNVSIQNNINKKSPVNKAKTKSECRILVEKLPENQFVGSKPTEETNKAFDAIEGNDNKKSVYNCVKSFWDTDFESDLESPAPKRPIFRPEDKKENRSKSNSTIIEDKIPKNKKPLNLSLVSVSESIKSKTMPTNNLAKIKLNISKTLSIKSFLTPKKKVVKPKPAKAVQKYEDVSKTKDVPDKPVTEPINNKKTIKQKTNPKSVKNVDTENINTETKVTITKNNTSIVNTTSKKTQSKPKTKNAKAQNEKPNVKTGNTSISGRTVRTPKRKACCEEPKSDHDTTIKSANKSLESKSKEKVSNSNKKPKITENTSTKTSNKLNDSMSQKAVTGKAAKKINDTTAKKTQAKSVKSNNKLETESEQPKNVEVLTMNRTLRSRRIDLSSSINSSSENVTLQIRNLRTRRVDLSNSLKNSSLDETIKKAPRSAAIKKASAKPNRTEILNKKPRLVKNHNQK